MSQSRGASLAEAATNVTVGWSVAFATQLVVFPLVGIEADLRQNLTVAAVFTVVSLARSYVLRRIFNHWSVKARTHGSARPEGA